MKKVITIIFFILSFNLFAITRDDIAGIWYTHKDKQGKIAIAEIYLENGKYYGYSFDYKNSADFLYDTKNPNKELSKLPLKGLIYIYDLKFNGNEWTSGQIYNPEDGKTYNLKAKLSSDKNTLTLRASVDGAGVFGKTMEWTRVENTSNYKTLNKNELHKSYK